MPNNNYGRILQPSIELQRKNFEEMCSLIGVRIQYQTPLKNKQYTTQGELETGYSEPEDVWCIFNNHIDNKTAKLLGWNVEVEQNTKASMISLPYHLHDLQIGCTVVVPSAFDNTPGRKFRIVELSAVQIYPASITCKLVPEYETTMDKADTELFINTDFNLLNPEE